MAHAGKIYPEYTQIEIDEDGIIWLIQNHYESESVITEMESTAHGNVIIDKGWIYADEELDYFDDLM